MSLRVWASRAPKGSSIRITEGRNAAGEEFGEEGIAASASQHRGLGADEMLAAMLKDIEAFNNGVYEDDATLIVAAL